MQDLKQLIGKNITKLRTSSKLTQAEFAEQLNYTDKAVSKWERGESLPDIVILKQIADMFGVKVDYLLSEHFDDEKPIVGAEKKIRDRNHFIIALMAIVIVWFLAVFVYFLADSVSGIYLWQAYLVAVPVSAIVALVFNSIWGKASVNYIIISVLMWSVLITAYVLLLKYNIWTIFLLGIPGQTSVVLWACLGVGKPQKTPKINPVKKASSDQDENAESRFE